MILGLIGFFASLASALLGIGGGVLLVPLLPYALELSAQDTVALSLLIILFIVLVNTFYFHKKKLVLWPVVLMLGPATGVSAFLAASVSGWFSGENLRLALACALLVLSLRYFKVLLQKKKEGENTSTSPDSKVLGLSLGLGAGILSGLLGIGSGVMVNWILFQKKWAIEKFQSPTASGVMVFTTFFAVLAYKAHYIDFYEDALISESSGALLIFGVLCGGLVGRPLQEKLKGWWRNLFLAGLLLFLALVVFIESLGDL